MQAIILAAGKGTRMRPLTNDMPKPLIEVSGTPLLSHILDQLPPAITEIILVIDYLGEMIGHEYGFEFKGKPITYVWQIPSGSGTFGALKAVKEQLGTKLDRRVLILNADDLPCEPDLKALLKHRLGVLATPHKNPGQFGVISHDDQMRLIAIDEQPAEPKSNLVNTGIYVLMTDVLDLEQYATRRGDELLLTPAVTELAQRHIIHVVPATFWIPVGTPEAILVAEAALREHPDYAYSPE